MVNLTWETHGGDDVAVFATGPWSHLFVGNYEQNYIPYAISYAAQMGPGAKFERKHVAHDHEQHKHNDSSSAKMSVGPSSLQAAFATALFALLFR